MKNMIYKYILKYDSYVFGKMKSLQRTKTDAKREIKRLKKENEIYKHNRKVMGQKNPATLYKNFKIEKRKK